MIFSQNKTCVSHFKSDTQVRKGGLHKKNAPTARAGALDMYRLQGKRYLFFLNVDIVLPAKDVQFHIPAGDGGGYADGGQGYG